MSNLKFYKNTECKEVTDERLVYLRDQFKFLQGEPQPAQRTQPWYDMRNGMLTASDWGIMLGDNPYSNPDDLILKKCGHEKPFRIGPAILWGVKYEEVAVQIYEHRNDVKVIEFGLIQHPTIKYLGASPDGITVDGIMLEIKCPKSRKITGVPPMYYFDQVQGQLEVCALDMCAFLECKLEEYENSADYYADNFNGDYFYNTYGHEKGVVAEFFNITDKSLKFEYGPLGGDKDIVEKWKDEIKEKHKDDAELVYIGVSYWYLLEVSCIPIYRDKEWFAKASVQLREFWDRILYYRENGLDEILNKPKKKRVNRSKQIFVDTAIDDYMGNLNSDGLFENIDKKLCLFSDDEYSPEVDDTKKKLVDDENVFSYKSHVKTKKNTVPADKKSIPSIKKEPAAECLFSDDEDD